MPSYMTCVMHAACIHSAYTTFSQWLFHFAFYTLASILLPYRTVELVSAVTA